MDAETHPAQEHDFGNPQWIDLGGYNPAQSPIHDFSGFVFGSPPVMPMDSSYSMSIHQPYTSQPLLPMTMSSQWPSMMSSQSGFAPVPLAPMPSMPQMPPMATPQPMQNSHYPTHPTPRRTLSDNDRRNMCRFHEENPNVKQTEIGAIFGVERSTVSKVLRQKEKYLNQDDSSTRSPAKRPRGKFHDIEKSLANWVRKQERQGCQISDAMIREKALALANAASGADSYQKIMSASWLSTFKQKNCLSGSTQKSISLNIASGLETSNDHSADQTPNGLSPGTPSATTSPSPLSPKQVQYEETRRGSVQGTTRVDGQEFTQHVTTSQAMSRSPSVPNSASAFFASENPFSPSDQSNEPSSASSASRPRRQTYPAIGAEAGLVTNDSSALESPMSSCQTSMGASTMKEEDHSLIEQATIMKRNHSNPEIKITTMQPPPLPKSSTISPVSCSPDSPTQDEARRALELVMNYFRNQPSGSVAEDCFTIGKLMERLELAQYQVVAQAKSLQRIDEYPDGPRVTKKRSIHTI